MNHYLKNKIREVIEDALYRYQLYETTLTSITLLLEDFKSQRVKYISQGHDAAIVDQYLDYFKQIKNGKYKQASNAELAGVNVPIGNARYDIDRYKTFRELEIVVDYIRGQRDVKSANFTDIEIDGKPVYRNSDVEIYYADSPEACIKYKGDKPYSWCVARPKTGGNLFYGYRFKSTEPAFYFVKRLKATEEEFRIWNKTAFTGKFKDKYHFFVIQVVNTADVNNENAKQYIVTSARNDGDAEMNWKQILKIAPELRGLNKIFEPKPLSSEERKKIDSYRQGLSDLEYITLPYEEKKYYIDVNIGRHMLTDEQFKATPVDLQNYYIGLGLGLTDGQFNLIKSDRNLLRRYREISYREYINRLNHGGYLDRLVNSQKEMVGEYFKTLDVNEIKKVLDLHIQARTALFDAQFEYLSYDLKRYYIEFGGYLTDSQQYGKAAEDRSLAHLYSEALFLRFKELLDNNGYDVYLSPKEMSRVQDRIRTLPVEEQIELYTRFFVLYLTNPHMEVKFTLFTEERSLIDTTKLPGDITSLEYLEVREDLPEFESLNNLRFGRFIYLNNLPNFRSLGHLEVVDEKLLLTGLPNLKSLGRLKKARSLTLYNLPNLQSLGSLEEADIISMAGTYLDNHYTVSELEEMYPQFKGKIKYT